MFGPPKTHKNGEGRRREHFGQFHSFICCSVEISCDITNKSRREEKDMLIVRSFITFYRIKSNQSLLFLKLKESTCNFSGRKRMDFKSAIKVTVLCCAPLRRRPYRNGNRFESMESKLWTSMSHFRWKMQMCVRMVNEVYIAVLDSFYLFYFSLL